MKKQLSINSLFEIKFSVKSTMIKTNINKLYLKQLIKVKQKELKNLYEFEKYQKYQKALY